MKPSVFAVPGSADPVPNRLQDHDRPQQHHHGDRHALKAVVDDRFIQRSADRIRFWVGWINRDQRVFAQIGNVDPQDNQDGLANQKDQRDTEHHRRGIPRDQPACVTSGELPEESRCLATEPSRQRSVSGLCSRFGGVAPEHVEDGLLEARSGHPEASRHFRRPISALIANRADRFRLDLDPRRRSRVFCVFGDRLALSPSVFPQPANLADARKGARTGTLPPACHNGRKSAECQIGSQQTVCSFRSNLARLGARRFRSKNIRRNVLKDISS